MAHYTITQDTVAVKYCGKYDRTIEICKSTPNTIQIGCFRGTKKEAIAAVKLKYDTPDKYIEQINFCFALARKNFNLGFIQFPSIHLSQTLKDGLVAFGVITTLIMLFISFANMFFSRETLTPLTMFKGYYDTSPFTAYCYLSLWGVVALTLIITAYKNITIIK